MTSFNHFAHYNLKQLFHIINLLHLKSRIR